MKALVIGAGGRLGSELMDLLPGATGLSHAELSITELAGVDRACAEHGPQVVFCCAAYNAVDRAEGAPAEAQRVNSDGASNVAIACRRHGARLVHFSTNYVFDGSLDRAYVESDEGRPLCVYGRSKLDGERAVLRILPEAVVIRTAALFGGRGLASNGGSFPERILARARRGERIRVVSDQRVNPTYARDLALAAIEIAASAWSGVLHVVAAGCCQWDELARATLAECRIYAEVESVLTADLPAPAKRPLNGCLDSERTGALRPWREGLRDWARREATKPEA